MASPAHLSLPGGGIDVYDAVLEHGIRTPAQFEACLTERGMPL